MTESAQAQLDTAVFAAGRMVAVSRTLSARAVVLMVSGATLWTTVIASAAVWRHNEFLSHRFDLGNMVQAVWSTGEGRPLQITDGHTGEQIVRFASHVDPVLALLVPVWWIHPGPESLIIAQTVVLASGIYPVVRLALKYTGSGLATGLLATWYLAFPWLVWNALNDVHAVTLAIPLLLYAIWFLDEDQLGRFALFAALAMLTGELLGLTVAALGVWYAISHGRRRTGLGIALSGISWTAICLVVLIPAFNDGRPSPFYGHFESVGGSPLGLARTLVSDPGAVLAQVTTAADVSYVTLLLLPTALLVLGAPALLAVSVPQLGINALSDSWSATQPMFQYVAPIVAPLVAASIIAFRRIPERARVAVAAVLLAVGLLSLLARPPVPGGQDFVFGSTESNDRAAAMRRAIELVPASAPVTATNRLGAHLSARRMIYVFPERSLAAWAVVDVRDAWLPLAGERVDEPLFRRLLARFERDPAWRLVFERSDVRVYRRVA